jgi:predicted nucleic acid-binding Zn ribbon protein
VGILRDELNEALRELGWESLLIQPLWQEIVGEEEARKLHLVGFRKGVLFVGVPSPSWAQEFSYKKREIIRKINISLGKEVVKKIVFRYLPKEVER